MCYSTCSVYRPCAYARNRRALAIPELVPLILHAPCASKSAEPTLIVRMVDPVVVMLSDAMLEPYDCDHYQRRLLEVSRVCGCHQYTHVDGRSQGLYAIPYWHVPFEMYGPTSASDRLR